MDIPDIPWPERLVVDVVKQATNVIMKGPCTDGEAFWLGIGNEVAHRVRVKGPLYQFIEWLKADSDRMARYVRGPEWRHDLVKEYHATMGS